jgi:NADH:ubiquinone reductase (H+-translocating)
VHGENAVPHVVIAGGGFGGLYAARQLRRAAVRITVIDRRNFHLFQPLLYQVATASLSPADIAQPIRTVLRRQQNTAVWMGEVTDVDPAARQVSLADGARIAYDYLILATGATHAYFGHDEWAEHAQGLKTIDDATEIRRRFLLAFEAAEREADAAAMQRLLTFVIVGAGPTGVELAGAMAEIARTVMPTDFRSIDTKSARIVLIEGMDRVLPTYPAELSAKAQRQLERLGVEVVTGAVVTHISAGRVQVGDEVIAAGNVFWAAGVAASKLGARLGVETDGAGRVVVEPDLSVAGHPELFVVGDLAAARRSDGSPVPGVAQGAIQGGKHAARQILNDLRGRPRSRFDYVDKGDLATIGRAAAVARIGRLRLSGFVAWLIWVLVHIMYLIGFRNRALVMLQWGWAYLTYYRGIRLITGDVELELERARGADGLPQPARRRTGASL